MTIAELLELARAAGFALDATDGNLAVEGYLEDHPEILRALSASKGAVITALTLSGPLVTGWAICETERDPARKTELEDHWIGLLHQYESECDQQLSPLETNASEVVSVTYNGRDGRSAAARMT